MEYDIDNGVTISGTDLIGDAEKDRDDEAFARRQEEIKQAREANQGKSDADLEAEADAFLAEAGSAELIMKD